MTALPLDPSVRPHLPAIEAALVAWIRARLATDEAASSWKDVIAGGWRALEDAPLGALLDADALADAVESALSSGAFARAVRPVVARVFAEERARLVEEKRAAEAFVPRPARDRLDALLARPRLAPEKLVREVLEQDAIEGVLRDVLYDALQSFSSKVNPFFAEWGLPALLRKVLPLGAGTVMKSLEGVRAEFDRRLEPEIRKFLQTFSRAALARAAGEVVAQQDDPKFVALRQEIARWVLAQPLGELVAMADEETATMGCDIVVDVVEHVANLADLRRERRARLVAWARARADRPVREVLAEHGVAWVPDLDALARATWPAVRELAGSGPVMQVVEREIHAFFAAASG